MARKQVFYTKGGSRSIGPIVKYTSKAAQEMSDAIRKNIPGVIDERWEESIYSKLYLSGHQILLRCSVIRSKASRPVNVMLFDCGSIETASEMFNDLQVYLWNYKAAFGDRSRADKMRMADRMLEHILKQGVEHVEGPIPKPVNGRTFYEKLAIDRL